MTPETVKAVLSETDVCSAFIKAAEKDGLWRAYPETQGFDILLVRLADGAQIGIEAKRTLNARVVCQALPHWPHYDAVALGPDYRAVLVHADKVGEMAPICAALGITVISLRFPGIYSRATSFTPDLPREPDRHGYNNRDWHEWAPDDRLKLPDYVPDVAAGVPSPKALTAWKIKAIKLAILLEDRPITRKDFRHLGLSPTLWTGPRGWLVRTPEGYVRGDRTPNLKAQHPRNYEEIRADKAKWAPVESPAPAAAEKLL